MSIFKNFLIGLDQAINCLFRLDGEYGLPDETLSARAWRVKEKHPKFWVWLDRIIFWDPEHCKTSYEAEVFRKHLSSEYA